MIRKGQPQDRKAIYDLHSEKVSLDQNDGMEFYFSQVFNADNIIVNEVNGHVVSSVQVNYHPIMFRDTRIECAVFCGAITRKDRPEFQKDLMDDVCDEVAHRTLVSILLTEDPDEGKQYGFEPVYYRRVYTIRQRDLANKSFEGVSREFNADDLQKTYTAFASHFDGYYLRDRNYWMDLYKQLQFLRGNIIVYRNEEGEIEGYMVYSLSQRKCHVHELVYLNGTALIRLLCFAFRTKNVAEVSVSDREDLTKAVPGIKFTRKLCACAKVNDFELFNRLFQSDDISSTVAFNTGRPLYLNERL